MNEVWWESALAGVVVGGLIALAGTALVEWWRDRTARARGLEAAQRQVRQAARLVLEELSDIELTILNSTEFNEYWMSEGRELPTSTWNEYRPVLADHLDGQEPWGVTAAAFQYINAVNWGFRRGTRHAGGPRTDPTVRQLYLEIAPAKMALGAYLEGKDMPEYTVDEDFLNLVFGPPEST